MTAGNCNRVRGVVGSLLVCLVAASALVVSAASSGDRTPDLFDIVVIDAGHGGEDKGARSKVGLLEKDLVLDVANRVADRLRSSGLTVVMTRQDDSFIALEKRTSIANDARGDLFVSIHANAANDPKIRGIETFFLALAASDDSASAVAKRENGAFERISTKPRGDAFMAMIGDLMVTQHLEESNEFARLAQGELATGSVARGVKQAPFVVLEGVQMPASLVEIGFLTNPEDEKLLSGSQGRDRVVAALVRATLEFGRRYDVRRGGGRR